MLKKILYLIAYTMVSAGACADTGDIKFSNNQIRVQAISTYVDYTETGNGTLGTKTGILDTESGPVGGFAVALSFMNNLLLKNDYLELNVDFSNGKTKYIGSYQGGTYGSVVTQSTATFHNFGGRYGTGFALKEHVMLTPYIELGKHQWYRGVNSGELYTHNYYGIGIMGQYSPIKKWVYSASFMYGSTFGSAITVNSGSTYSGFSGALGNSAKYKAGLSADYAISKEMHLNAGIEYVSFSYGMSGIYPIGGGYVAWEPDSKTNFTIFKLGLGSEF
jgi:hypothetical protein